MWNEENVTKLTFSDAYIDDTVMYVSHNAYNGLFKINRKNNEAIFIRYFDNEEKGKPLLHSRIIRRKNSLFFLPYWANGISKYEIDSGKMEHYNLEHYFTVDFLEDKEKIILFPSFLIQPVVAFYPESKRLAIEDAWTKILRDNVFGMEFRGFVRINQIGEKIYIGIARTNILLKIDKNNIENYKSENLDLAGNSIYDVFSDGKDKLWITTFKGREMYEYSIESGDIRGITDTVCTEVEKYIFQQNDRIFVVSAGKTNKNIGIIEDHKVCFYSMIPEEQMFLRDLRADFDIIGGNMKFMKNTSNILQCPVNQTHALSIESGKIGLQLFSVDASTLNVDEIVYANKSYTIPLRGKIREQGVKSLYAFINSVKKQKKAETNNERRSGGVIYKTCLS